MANHAWTIRSPWQQTKKQEKQKSITTNPSQQIHRNKAIAKWGHFFYPQFFLIRIS